MWYNIVIITCQKDNIVNDLVTKVKGRKNVKFGLGKATVLFVHMWKYDIPFMSRYKGGMSIHASLMWYADDN